MVDAVHEDGADGRDGGIDPGGLGRWGRLDRVDKLVEEFEEVVQRGVWVWLARLLLAKFLDFGAQVREVLVCQLLSLGRLGECVGCLLDLLLGQGMLGFRGRGPRSLRRSSIWFVSWSARE